MPPMILLDPRNLNRPYPDERSGEIMRSTVEFFEHKGKAQLKRRRPRARLVPDFLDFQGRERIFATLLHARRRGRRATAAGTPGGMCEFAEILGFYGLPYWYTWQVSILGLGPIWMSANEGAASSARRSCSRTARSSRSASPSGPTARTSTRPT